MSVLVINKLANLHFSKVPQSSFLAKVFLQSHTVLELASEAWNIFHYIALG